MILLEIVPFLPETFNETFNDFCNNRVAGREFFPGRQPGGAC
jgi:hypothetical protein